MILAGCCGVVLAHHPADLTIRSPETFLQDHDGREPALRLTAQKGPTASQKPFVLEHRLLQ
jgi:hypothetical protein